MGPLAEVWVLGVLVCFGWARACQNALILSNTARTLARVEATLLLVRPAVAAPPVLREDVIGSAASPSIAAAFLQPVVVCSYGLSVPKIDPEGLDTAHTFSP